MDLLYEREGTLQGMRLKKTFDGLEFLLLVFYLNVRLTGKVEGSSNLA